ncbi:unnamed protein product [Peniophora sp. CBMAI 1063]|nr:unnamed protein product [Peniophora sp. CBMAI 1063]
MSTPNTDIWNWVSQQTAEPSRTLHPSNFPNPSLTSLELDERTIVHGIDGLLRGLRPLPQLRKLDLSRLSQSSQSIAFERRDSRCLPFPELDYICLRDSAAAIENILHHLDFPPTTIVKLVGTSSMGSDQADDTETLLRNIALDLQSRWGDGGRDGRTEEVERVF